MDEEEYDDDKTDTIESSTVQSLSSPINHLEEEEEEEDEDEGDEM